MTLGEFIERCSQYFAWSGFLIDQPFQSRLADGLIRCYLVHNEVVGFQHQWPRGLLDAAVLRTARRGAAGQEDGSGRHHPIPTASLQDGARVGAADARASRHRHLDLPVIWDADFLYGPKNDAGDDTYVLCEVNVSAVWPFPPQATRSLAAAASGAPARITATSASATCLGWCWPIPRGKYLEAGSEIGSISPLGCLSRLSCGVGGATVRPRMLRRGGRNAFDYWWSSHCVDGDGC